MERPPGPPEAVAVVTRFYPPYGDGGGAEVQAQRLARFLAARSRACEIVTTRFRADLPASGGDGGIRLRRLPTGPGPLRQAVEFAFAFAWFLANGGRFRLVQVFCLSAFSLGGLLGARLRGARTILLPCSIGERGDVAKVRRRPGGALLWWLFRTTDLMLPRTVAAAEELAANGVSRSRIARLPGLLDPSVDGPIDQERPAIRSALALPERPTVLYVGRLVEAKGVGTILEAWSRIADAHDATLVLVGDGALRARAEAAAASSGRPNAIVVVGHRDDPGPYYRASDLFLYPSYSEAFGNALAEAMAMGLAVIATRTGLATDWIRDGEEGLIVEAGDPVGLAAAIEGLLVDPGRRRRLAANALGRARQAFSPRVVGEAHLELYRRLLERAGASAETSARRDEG